MELSLVFVVLVMIRNHLSLFSSSMSWQAWASWAPTLASWASSYLLTPSRCHCDCAFAGGGVDSGLLQLLQKQLDRCGPERLGPAPATCVCGSSGVVLGFIIGLAFGLSVAVVIALVVHRRHDGDSGAVGVEATEASKMAGGREHWPAALRLVRPGRDALPRAPSRGALAGGRLVVGGDHSD